MLASFIVSGRGNTIRAMARGEQQMEDGRWITLMPLYISFFVALLYFIPVIKTQKKALLYSIVIPFFCCVMTHTMNMIIFHILKWKLPSYLIGKTVGESIYNYIDYVVFGPYIESFSWLISLFLMLTCALYLRASRRARQHPERWAMISVSPFQRTVMEMRLFQHKKLTLGTLLVYLAFMMIYFKLYQSFWFENTPAYRTYGFFAYVYLLSFLSLFILAPILIGRIKRTLAFCALAPLFWSVAIFALLAAMAFLFAHDRYLVFKEVSSIHFYLDRYLKTLAWLIGLPLLLVCCLYHRLAKSELARRVEWRKT
jgi:hypothetical protein